VKKERDCRRKPQKERGKTTLNVSKTSCKKATSELAHNRYQTTALVRQSNNKSEGWRKMERAKTRPGQTRLDRTGPDKRHTTSRNRCQQAFFYFCLFLGFWDKFIFKMAKQCGFFKFSSSQISSNF
jgi:hypothetical protein